MLDTPSSNAFMAGTGRRARRSMPVYDFADWRITYADPNRLVFRPSLATFGRQCLITLFAGIVAALMLYAMQSGATGLLKGSLREYGLLSYYRQQDIPARIMLVIVGITIFLGILSPLSVLWGQIVFNRDIRGNLSVFVWKIIPRSRHYNFQAFSNLQYGAEEIIHRTRRRQETEHYWRWFVRLMPAGSAQVAGPPPPLDLSSSSITFYPYRQKGRPGAKGRPPETVLRILSWLRAPANYPVTGPLYIEETSEQRDLFGGRRKQLVDFEPKVTFRTQYGSEDLLPPQAQAEVLRNAEELVRRGGPGVHRAQQVTYQDSLGNVHTGASLEDLPPDVRKGIQQARVGAGNVAQTFRFQDANGVEHTYHSLEEMPPELREMFRRKMEEFHRRKP